MAEAGLSGILEANFLAVPSLSYTHMRERSDFIQTHSGYREVCHTLDTLVLGICDGSFCPLNQIQNQQRHTSGWVYEAIMMRN